MRAGDKQHDTFKLDEDEDEVEDDDDQVKIEKTDSMQEAIKATQYEDDNYEADGYSEEEEEYSNQDEINNDADQDGVNHNGVNHDGMNHEDEEVNDDQVSAEVGSGVVDQENDHEYDEAMLHSQDGVRQSQSQEQEYEEDYEDDDVNHDMVNHDMVNQQESNEQIGQAGKIAHLVRKARHEEYESEEQYSEVENENENEASDAQVADQVASGSMDAGYDDYESDSGDNPHVDAQVNPMSNAMGKTLVKEEEAKGQEELRRRLSIESDYDAPEDEFEQIVGDEVD